MSENRISEEHANPQSRHALGAPLGTPAMSSHHAAGAAFPQLPFPSVHHHSLFPMMPPGLSLSGGPFSHQNKNAHGINDMGPPMFSVPLNLGVPGQNSNQGAPASLPYDGFNPDSLLASNRTTTTKITSKLPTPTNNYVVSAMQAANRPDSPNKKKMINMTVPPASLNNQQPKTKPAPLSLSNSHVLLSSHQSTTTGNNSSGAKSAFSVVVPPTSTSCGKIPTEDGEMIINRNMFLKDASGTTIDVLHSINNSNNQFRVVATSEPSTNNLHWKQTSSISEAVTAAIQNSCTNTSAGSKALGSHTSGGHTMAGQGGGVTEASGGATRHNKPSNPLTGTSAPPPTDSGTRVPTSMAWSSVTHPHNDKAPHPPPTVVTNVTRALSSNATNVSAVTSSSSVNTTLVKPQPQWPSRDHMSREGTAAPPEADRPHSNSLPLQTTQQQAVTQSPTSNRPSILRKRPVDSMKRDIQSYSKTTGGQQGMASPTNGFLDYHGNQSPANENAAIYPSNALRLEDQGVPDFMSPRKKPRKQLVNPTEDHYASNVPTSNMDTPTRSHGRDESTPTSLPSTNSETQSTTQDKSPESITLSAPLHRSPYSVCSNYKPYTKAAHSHFWRYTDVRVKEDNKQQSMSFLNGKTISKQATGWKLSRVQHHLDEVDKLEQKILEITLKLQRRLENTSSNVLPCSNEELKSFKELVQGNVDRSNRAMSETAVVKENMAKVLTHKSRAMNLVQRYQAYRQQNLVKHPKRRKTH